jgi:hypothetical protein
MRCLPAAAMMAQKGWQTADILMEEYTLHIPAGIEDGNQVDNGKLP